MGLDKIELGSLLGMGVWRKYVSMFWWPSMGGYRLSGLSYRRVLRKIGERNGWKMREGVGGCEILGV